VAGALECNVIVIVLVGSHPSLRWDEMYMASTFAGAVVGGLLWFVPCWYFSKYLHTPAPGLELQPNQEVRRACLVECSGCGNANQRLRTKTLNALSALFRGTAVAVCDFDLRNMAYRLRTVVLAGVVLTTVIARVVVTRLTGSGISAVSAVILLMLFAIKALLLVDTYMTVFDGIGRSWSGMLAKKVLRCSPAYRAMQSHFTPFDPRATCVQNLVFQVFLAPSAIASVVIFMQEENWFGCPAMWLAESVTALILLLILQLGAAYSYCPFTFAVGLCVQSGLIAPPFTAPCGFVVRKLSYGIMGPIIELHDAQTGPA